MAQKLALITKLQNSCSLWVMRSKPEPDPEILSFNLNDLEEAVVSAAVNVIRECRPDAKIEGV